MKPLRFLMSCLACAVFLGACGSISGTAPSKWASGYCSAMFSWYTQTQSKTGSFESLIKNQSDPTQIKADAQTLIQEEIAQAQTLESQIRHNGTPAVSDGKTLYNSLIKALNAYDQALVGAQNTLAPISTSSITNLTGAFNQIGNTIDAAQVTLGRSLSSIGRQSTSSSDSPLAQALDTNKYCKNLQSLK